jgi:GIY-YIG catalytic domain-containing protein
MILIQSALNPRFVAHLERLQPSLNHLLAMNPVTLGRFPPEAPKRGVYVFTEPARGHLYVGRSNDIPGRYGRHCKPGATHRMAAFAFRLAREETGKLKASYRPGADSRKGLMSDSEFRAAFERAKARIRAMEFRCVEETDPVTQCLLEVYAATALQTPYNDFDNH